MKNKRSVGFLNVDLEIESFGPLDSLCEEMGKAVTVLYSGPSTDKRYLLSLESSKSLNRADGAARALCSTIEGLSPTSRRLWDCATLRVFDVGYELSDGVRAVNVVLSPETLARIVALRATVAFTCYQHSNSEPDGAANGSQPIRSKPSSTSSEAGSNH